jgi:hypothetical protein
VEPATEPALPQADVARARLTRGMWHAIGLVLAALLAYAVWRGYQNPDLVIDLSALRLC